MIKGWLIEEGRVEVNAVIIQVLSTFIKMPHTHTLTHGDIYNVGHLI